MKSFKTAVLFLISLITALFYWWTSHGEHRAPHALPPIVQTESWPRAVEYAREHLPMEGVLKDKSGFVYLKVDNDYIYSLFPMLDLKKYGFQEPPYFRTNTSPGAHISVIYVDERVVPREIGETFHFNLKKIRIVNTSKASFAILEVESPELEALRKRYGLSPKLKGHEFHISLAEKSRR